MSVQFENGYAGASWLKRQWPWWTAGLMTAIAEIINYTLLPLGHPKHKFIGVTSGMARMLAGVESTLFGHSLIATKADYQPSLQWIIIGALIAAFVLAWLEGEFRSWVRYPKGTLIATAFGAFFFAWGTRVAGGCTLHHLLGGWAAMNIKSWVVMIMATVGALIAFLLLRKLNLSQYFKSQETRWYVEEAQKRGWADGLTRGESTKPSLLSWILYVVLGIVFLVVVYMAFFGTNYAVVVGFSETFEKTKIAGAMITGKNLPNIIMLIIVGLLLGASVAKTGFGTECGIINFELGREMEKGEAKAADRWGTPYSLRTVMLSYQPLGALALHIALVALVMLIGFAFFNIMEGHNWATDSFAAKYVGPEFHKVGAGHIREQTTLPMDLFGGLLLGFGTVLMLGCEFRNYGRTGLLYVTGLLIWPFFYVGYLPYTLARDFWDGLMATMPYTPTTFFPALVAPGNKMIQSLIWLLWILFWAWVFWWAMKRGAKNIGVQTGDMFRMNSEDMYLARLAKLEKEGKLDEVDEIEKDL
ncbi:MAG TPA: YeeE/YedE family protein, partial [Caldilineae bacterium]|nr:YeeE/YedE family protein [Caldilineae bacterium]